MPNKTLDKSPELNKTTFAEFIAKNQRLSKSESVKAIEIVLEEIEAALKAGYKINLTGFGAFYTLRQEAREGRNPRTGEPLQIAASNAVKFKAGTVLKAACNKC